MTRYRVTEGEIVAIPFDISGVGYSGSPLPALTVAELTLYDYDTFESVSPAIGIINARAQQDVLNTNDVVIDSSGHVVWTLQPEDNVIVTERRQIERHRALFHAEWDGGSFDDEVEIEVVNHKAQS